MWRADIKNHAFDRFGESFNGVLDSSHFLGRSAFDIPYLEHAQAASVHEYSNPCVLELAVPGFSKEDLEIHQRDDILTIRGSRVRSDHQYGMGIILEDVAYDAFERTFKLIPGAGEKKISASFSGGILKLIFELAEDSAGNRFRKIRIE
jgi:HSP20 family protein